MKEEFDIKTAFAEVKAKETVSVAEKIDMIELSINEATVGGFVNPVLMKILLEVNFVLAYTDIKVSYELLMNKFALYDLINKFDYILKNIESRYPGELAKTEEWAFTWVYSLNDYNNSFNGILQDLKLFLTEFLAQTTESIEVLKDIDMSKLAEVSSLAKALNIDNSLEEMSKQV